VRASQRRPCRLEAQPLADVTDWLEGYRRFWEGTFQRLDAVLDERNGWSWVVCDIDLRVGGTYRYVWRQEADGFEMGMRGVFREIVPSERIVATEKFDEAQYPGEALVTTVFAERGGTTTLTSTIQYESREARDVVLKSPMESGVAESYDQLAELLASLEAPATEREASRP
jgi:uncharacterized protein YndB with AHSA1/START domain